jgi:predicted nucleotidyltransferase
MESRPILLKLKAQKDLLKKKFGVEEIGVFGSIVNGNANSNSDIDIIVGLNSANYTNYYLLKRFLEKLLNAEVDLIRRGPHLSSQFIASIETNIIYV